MSNQLERRIRDLDIEAECVDLITRLVPVGQPDCANSLDPEIPGGTEQAIAAYVGDLLKELGLTVTFVESMPGRPNVIGVLDGQGDGPTLILNDHLDTYPSGDPHLWTESGGDPFHPTIKGRKIYGRGTSDTRGNLATIIMALRTLKRQHIPIKGRIICAFTVDEEKNGRHGALYLLEQHGLRGDYEITAEPTGWTVPTGEWGLGIGVAHSGHCLLDVTVYGTSSHLWRPDVGINANDMMALFISRLRDIPFRFTSPPVTGPTGPVAVAVRMEGGKLGEGQFTPHTATARIAVVGLVPGMTLSSALEDVRQFVADLHAARPEFQADVSPIPGETFVPATHEVPEDTPHLRHLQDAYREVLGQEPVLYRKNAYCDTIRFSHAGIPALTFGPGEDGWAPINEAIHIDKVVAATKILTLTIMRLLS